MNPLLATPEYSRLMLRDLLRIATNENLATDLRTRQLYALLQKFIGDLVDKEQIALYSYLSQIAYLCHKYEVPTDAQRFVFAFRARYAAVIYEQKDAYTDELYQLARYATTHFIATIANQPVPDDLQTLLPAPDFYSFATIDAAANYPRLRVVVTADSRTDNYFICHTEAFLYEKPLRLHYNIAERNSAMRATVGYIRHRLRTEPAVMLMLHNADIDHHNGIYADIFIIDPDYLLEVTAVSECFDAPNEKPMTWQYLLKKFTPTDNTIPLMTGNIANAFLDELLHHDGDVDTIDFVKYFPTMFKISPLQFCKFDDEEIKKLYSQTKVHFDTIKTMVKTGFAERGILPKDCCLEPSFYAPDCGVTGRLDLLYQSPKGVQQSAIVELKSGKPFHTNRFGINNNHYVQTLLYDLMLKAVNKTTDETAKYILYSAMPDTPLIFAPATVQAQADCLAARNHLASIDYQLTELTDRDAAGYATILDELKSRQADRLSRFLRENLEAFVLVFDKLNALERAYFIAYTGFIAREHRLAKVGTDSANRIGGMAALWRISVAEKKENFGVFDQIKIAEFHGFEEIPSVTLLLNDALDAATPQVTNFRVGDIVVLYAAPTADASPLHTQIFKCTILSLTATHIRLRLRAKQHKTADFKNPNMTWNVEPDVMESGYKQLYANLFAFMSAPQHQRNLLFGTVAPRRNDHAKDILLPPSSLTAHQRVVLQKAIASEDYFLLWGPPGTGKTSQLLKRYVQYFIANTNEKLVLLAFTNRAVEEICEAIEDIGEAVQNTYLRLGTRTTSAPKFHSKFLEEKTKAVANRKSLIELIDAHRIIVGTVAAVMQKTELFELHRSGRIRGFDRVVIDEASQLTEPMLVGLLPRFQHFLLVGDHRQLPAVVAQKPEQSATYTKHLHDIGLTNLRNSLFERLFIRAQQKQWSWAYDKLNEQGRMHAELNEFPKRFFYDNDLQPLAAWQNAPSAIALNDKNYIKRLRFLRAETDLSSPSGKTNLHEALIIKDLVLQYYNLYKHRNQPFTAQTLGIITPYRAQIAVIKATLEADAATRPLVPLLTIDTVERYQGGARDVILISVCCNSAYQLETLVALHIEGNLRIDRKLNVALTRARHYLALVGNPDVLNLDETYAALIKHILSD